MKSLGEKESAPIMQFLQKAACVDGGAPPSGEMYAYCVKGLAKQIHGDAMLVSDADLDKLVKGLSLLEEYPSEAGILSRTAIIGKRSTNDSDKKKGSQRVSIRCVLLDGLQEAASPRVCDSLGVPKVEGGKNHLLSRTSVSFKSVTF